MFYLIEGNLHSHYYDTISSDQNHDTYMTLCCLNWFFETVCFYKLPFNLEFLEKFPNKFKTFKLWSDNCHHFHSSQFMYQYRGKFLQKGILFIGNYFEAGEGKNDIDRHFGFLVTLEHYFLMKFDVIDGVHFTFLFIFIT